MKTNVNTKSLSGTLILEYIVSNFLLINIEMSLTSIFVTKNAPTIANTCESRSKIPCGRYVTRKFWVTERYPTLTPWKTVNNKDTIENVKPASITIIL